MRPLFKKYEKLAKQKFGTGIKKTIRKNKKNGR